MRHRAPRILVPPRAAAGHASRARFRAVGVALGRPRVVGLVLPVEAPLVADAGEREQAPGIGRRLGWAGRPIEAGPGRALVAPGKARAVQPAPRRLLPLGLRREPHPG